ncbi:MAG: hypothetical protein ACK4WH_04995 [Phycisphaerales bacterium]
MPILKPATFRTLVVMFILVTSACKPQPSNPRTPVRPVAPPTGNIVLMQRFDFADGSQDLLGTAFFARTPGGRVVGVTSAHFLDFDGPCLKSATWITRDGDEIGFATHSLGRPGNAGILTDTLVDLRSDYLLLHPARDINPAAAGYAVLEFDARAGPAAGERVWLPIAGDFLDDSDPPRLIAGFVDLADPGAFIVVLDERLELIAESGSPIISQNTGKVIGILSRGGTSEGKTRLFVAPSSGVLGEINRAEQSRGGLRVVPLESTIGKRP